MTEPAPDPPLELLLSDAEARMPVLEGGLPEATLVATAAPGEPRGVGSLYLDAPDRDPNLLDLQRWGVIAPVGEQGDRLIAAVAALIEHRRVEQGSKPRVFRVPAGQDAVAAIRWRDEVLRAESVPEHERPRYLLILGDLTQVSLELQQTLAHGCFVGRLGFADEAAYSAYAEKVLTWERTARELPRALYYTAQDGTSAISAGYRHLVQPCAEMADRWRLAGKLELAEPAITLAYSDDGPAGLIAAAGSREASVLLSLSHGLGAPRRGWRSVEQQRRTQGALCLGLDGDPLSAETLGSSAFLPGGIWLMIACFGAGTPADSAYLPWLQALAQRGGEGQAAGEVLRSLPRAGEPPFLAALPQAALANPRGPLAVIGHVDLAWSFAFMDGGRGSRASRIFGAQRALLAGSRAGVALDSLMQAYREANDDLSAGYQLQREASARGREYLGDTRKVAQLWMRRNDLRGYLLLGDPAAHLPLTRARARVGEPGMPSLLIDLRDPARAKLATRPAAPVPKDRSEVKEATDAASEVAAAAAESVAVEPVRALAEGVVAAVPVRAAEAPQAPVVGAGASEERRRERAVLALLRGGEAPLAIAGRFGVELDALLDWLERYREAGRRGLVE